MNNLNAISPGIKVINGYRPSFPEFVPNKMQELIMRSWSGKVSERPSFEEIFNEPSSDFSYLGELVEEDEIEDYLISLDASKNENTFYNIGYLYDEGLGVKRDYSKALEYYQKSSDLEYSSEFNNIGYLYHYGLRVE